MNQGLQYLGLEIGVFPFSLRVHFYLCLVKELFFSFESLCLAVIILTISLVFIFELYYHLHFHHRFHHRHLHVPLDCFVHQVWICYHQD
jgi:hypothetical protein